MVRKGVLHRVPHIGGKVLIPRSAVDELLAGEPPPERRTAMTADTVSPLRSASGP
jgi:hypothetical protein